MRGFFDIKRDNERAARAAKYPPFLGSLGKFRLKRQPRTEAQQRFAAVYGDRAGKEYHLSLEDSLRWEQFGEVSETPTMIPFNT